MINLLIKEEKKAHNYQGLDKHINGSEIKTLSLTSREEAPINGVICISIAAILKLITIFLTARGMTVLTSLSNITRVSTMQLGYWETGVPTPPLPPQEKIHQKSTGRGKAWRFSGNILTESL